MPQPARFRRNHRWAFSSERGALVIKATSSSFRPWVWRKSRAAWAAMGKPTSSAVTAAVRITRFSARPLLSSCVRASVGVAWSGGEIRSGSGYFFFDVGPKRGLIVFDGEQVVAAGLDHHFARSFVLGVQCVQANESILQIQRRDQLLLRDRNLIGLFIHNGAAQVVLAGHGHGSENGSTAAMPRLLAVHDHKFVARRWTAKLLVHGQQSLVEIK